MTLKQYCDSCSQEIDGFGSDTQDLHLKVKIEQFYLYHDFGEKIICEDCSKKLLSIFGHKPYHKDYNRKRGLLT